ncbi:cytochrome c oxidase family protein-like protein [Pyrenochaeta sp. DS3sAY3a]|nr:cytochrome c oxidase family protein-like protein [Pyrenochaeta sp. DS3sAY3a]
MAVKPITGMLRRQVVLDISVALGLGLTTGYAWWYAPWPSPQLIVSGYHVPAVRHRDAFYQKIEDERAAALGQK